jgi:predicted Zn-dependent peptidase
MKALALAALLAGPAIAKEAPPEPGPPKDFHLPPQRKLTLDNGMKVTMVQWGTVPKVLVYLTVAAGNVDEPKGRTWLANLTADMLTQGTLTRTASQLAEAAAGMGGELSTDVSSDLTDVSIDVLNESGVEAVKLVADVVRNPSFPEADFARRRNDRLRRLSIARSQPQRLAEEKFVSVLYPDHPYGRLLPTAEELQALTLEQVRGFHAANFGAARAHLYLIGRFDAGQLEAAVRAAFGDWKRGTEAAPRPPSPHAERKIYLVDRPGAVQSTIYLGMPVIDPTNPDYLKLVVANALLGGSFNSRITSNIREQKGYTYSPISLMSWRRRDVHWVQTADVTTKDTGASLKEIFGEIARLKAEPPSAQEVLGIQRYVAGIFVLRNTARDRMVQQLRFVDLQGLPDDWLDKYVQRVYAVTPKDVQEMTAKYIADDKAAIVVVGDEKTVREQVAPFGPVAQ